jgi:hypothetical protein
MMNNPITVNGNGSLAHMLLRGWKEQSARMGPGSWTRLAVSADTHNTCTRPSLFLLQSAFVMCKFSTWSFGSLPKGYNGLNSSSTSDDPLSFCHVYVLYSTGHVITNTRASGPYVYSICDSHGELLSLSRHDIWAFMPLHHRAQESFNVAVIRHCTPISAAPSGLSLHHCATPDVEPIFILFCRDQLLYVCHRQAFFCRSITNTSLNIFTQSQGPLIAISYPWLVVIVPACYPRSPMRAELTAITVLPEVPVRNTGTLSQIGPITSTFGHKWMDCGLLRCPSLRSRSRDVRYSHYYARLEF